MNYENLLLQIRLLADQNGDARSLVAIAAQFERDVESSNLPSYMKNAIKLRAHCRNEKVEQR